MLEAVDMRRPPGDAFAPIDVFFARQHNDVLVGTQDIQYAQSESVAVGLAHSAEKTTDFLIVGVQARQGSRTRRASLNVIGQQSDELGDVSLRGCFRRRP